MLPAAHMLWRHAGPPFYSAAGVGAVSPDRPDSPHTDGLEWLRYEPRLQAGTARTDILVGSVDPWADDVARYRYGWWGPGPNLYSD